MGYTHYWEAGGSNARKSAEWSHACAKAFSIFKNDGGEVAFESDSDKPPVFSSKLVRFNGVGEDGCETFLISAANSRNDFCKTGRRPYDTLVVACLCLLEHLTDARVYSDGGIQDWHDGLALARKVIPKCKMPKGIDP